MKMLRIGFAGCQHRRTKQESPLCPSVLLLKEAEHDRGDQAQSLQAGDITTAATWFETSESL